MGVNSRIYKKSNLFQSLSFSVGAGESRTSEATYCSNTQRYDILSCSLASACHVRYGCGIHAEWMRDERCTRYDAFASNF